MEGEFDFVTMSSKLQNTLLHYHSIPEDEWHLAKKTNDVTVWRKQSEEFSGSLYKCEGVVQEVTSRIMDYLRPGPYRLHWDSLMTTLDITKEINQSCLLVRYTISGMLLKLISPREFFDFSYTTTYEDGILSCGIGIEQEAGRPDCVRGFNHPCGWFCVPLQDNPEHSLLTGYVQTDLRGMLPRKTLEFAMGGSLTNFFSELRKALKA
uniref:StAR related lipid transfer domain containing 4 n=1 Tax=Leptobrachium leishanense TaxID=445787 RepID=A0A8C5P8D1_9ANUR